MDATSDAIAAFVAGLEPATLPPIVLHQARLRLVDSLGCAIGALDSPPARIARDLASEVSATRPATAIGLARPTTPEAAAFANTAMVRYLDFNDMFFSPIGGGAHPSDIIPTGLAVGESVGASGASVLCAIVAGYEVLGRLAGTVRLRERGWDQGIHVVVAAAMIAGKLLGLDREQLAEAVSLAIIPNVATRATRVGELSMWKGCATAGAARAGIYAALLAGRGMTGPAEPFDGFDGIKHRVTGPFDLAFEARPESFVIEQVHTKYRPAEYNAQAPIDLAVELREQVGVQDIERIDVETYWLAYSEIGMEPAKWRPQTRETADHSLPYLLAVAITDGDVSDASFGSERLADPALRALMDRIHVGESKDYTSRFPAELLCSITIRTRDGREVAGEIAHPRGHVLNPLSDAEIDHKFDGLIAGLPEADQGRCLDLRTALWQFDALADVGTVLRPLGELAAL